MDASLLVNLKEPIVYIASLNKERLAVVTQHSQLLIIDKASQEIQMQYNIANMHLEALQMDISSDGLYFAYIQQKPNKLCLLNLQTKELKHSIATHRNRLTIVHFDASGKYILAGTQSGRLFLWSIYSSKPIARLSSFPEYNRDYLPPKENFVSLISNHNDYSITSGYGGSIVITNLHTQFKTQRLHTPAKKITSVVVLDNFTLIAASSHGDIYKIATKTSKTLETLHTSFVNIDTLLLLKDERYALISNSSTHLALLDTKIFKIVQNSYITTPSPVTSIALDSQSNLITSSLLGDITHYNLYPTKELSHLIKTHHYQEAYALVESNIVLKRTPEFKLLEEQFAHSYAQALEALLRGHKTYAETILKAFVHVTSKQKAIHTLYYAMQHYPRLEFLVVHKRYMSAYQLADEYEPLKYTPAYKKMESHFEHAFDEAQRSIVKKEYQRAKKLLSDFVSVTQKAPLIQLVNNAPSTLISYIKAVYANAHAKIESITTSYPVLKKLPSYLAYDAKCQAVLESCEKALREQHIDEAKRHLAHIKDIPRFHAKVAPLEHFIKEASHFYSYYEQKNFLLCLALIDKQSQLQKLPLVQELSEEWADLMLDCDALALKGDAHTIKAILMELIELTTRETKIGNIFRLAYQVQLEKLLEGYKPLELQNGLLNYLTIFGVDSESLDIIAQAKEVDLHLHFRSQLLNRKSRDCWLAYRSRLPDFIYDKV